MEAVLGGYRPITPNSSRTSSVSTIEIMIEPAQPSRFEKKKNMGAPP